MKIDKYEMGKWIKNYCELPWCVDDDKEVFLEKNGFSTWGHDLSLDDIYYSFYAGDGIKRDQSHFLVDVNFLDTFCYFFIIEDAPSLMMFNKEFVKKPKVEKRFIRVNNFIYNIDYINRIIYNYRTKNKAKLTLFDNEDNVIANLDGFDAARVFNDMEQLICDE